LFVDAVNKYIAGEIKNYDYLKQGISEEEPGTYSKTAKEW
jgi:hypothetical protein